MKKINFIKIRYFYKLYYVLKTYYFHKMKVNSKLSILLDFKIPKNNIKSELLFII